MDYKYFENSRISDEPSQVFLESKIPLAGGFLTKEERGTDKTYPLSLSFCPESCSVQVNESINPKILFSKYLYKTGAIKTLKDHLRHSANIIKSYLKCEKVVDLGCNDFTFLKNFLGGSKKIVGVDPSDVSKNNQVEGINLINDFFSFQKSQEIKKEHGAFDLVFTSNNFAHIEDIQDYAKGAANILNDRGTFVCEVHWLGTIIEKMQFPFIYHEHLYYYTLKSLQFLLKKYGLYVNHVQEIDIHGGSIRIFASKKNILEGFSVLELLEKEEKMGLYNLKTYQDFANKIDKLKLKTKAFFAKAKKQNKKVYGYGASGQANTLMSFFEIEAEDMPYIIDDSPLKNGLLTPRNHIEIKDKTFLEENPPDYIYVLAYTFFDEIKNKNSDLETSWFCPI
jgi:methylation protein EvaC